MKYIFKIYFTKKLFCFLILFLNCRRGFGFSCFLFSRRFKIVNLRLKL